MASVKKLNKIIFRQKPSNPAFHNVILSSFGLWGLKNIRREHKTEVCKRKCKFLFSKKLENSNHFLFLELNTVVGVLVYTLCRDLNLDISGGLLPISWQL